MRAFLGLSKFERQVGNQEAATSPITKQWIRLTHLPYFGIVPDRKHFAKRKTMLRAKLIYFLLSVMIASIVPMMAAEESMDQPDQISQMLFDAYIARRGMINWSTIAAASHIVAERGRNSGFWKIVFSELQRGKEDSEIGCVRVLGMMLAIDALARDRIRWEKETGQVGQWVASVCLGPEVVKELIDRGRAANRLRVDDYAIALMRARVPETTEFFRTILRDDTGLHYMDETEFYAAVGLAQLGEADGFTWLIKNSENQLPTISKAWPSGVSNHNLDTCSVAALRDLSGEKNLKSKKEWESWWKGVDRKSLPKAHMSVEDS